MGAGEIEYNQATVKEEAQAIRLVKSWNYPVLTHV